MQPRATGAFPDSGRRVLDLHLSARSRHSKHSDRSLDMPEMAWPISFTVQVSAGDKVPQVGT